MTDPTSGDDGAPETAADLRDPVNGVQFAAFLAARLCHDFISPAGAIASGVDLLEDPTAQDMRDDALGLIAASARKLVAQLSFDRVAFGGSSAAETFDPRDLEKLTRDVFAHGRAKLDWAIEPQALEKPAARMVLNLAQVGAGALPIGGMVKVSAVADAEGGLALSAHASGTRMRMRVEVIDGLNGMPLGEGLSGHWVQAFFLRSLVDMAGGVLEIELGEAEATVRISLPR